MSVIKATRIFPQGELIPVKHYLVSSDDFTNSIKPKSFQFTTFLIGEDVEFDQSWDLPFIKLIENIDDIDKSLRYIISNFSWSPGLGNLMFQYGSLRAIAERYGAKLIVPVKCKLRRAFKLDAVIVSNEVNAQLIQKYGQHERYFDENLIRQEFTFLPEIVEQADGFLLEAKYEKLHSEVTVKKGSNENDQVDIIEDFDAGRGYVYIGVHIRYGIDITMNSRNIKYGHTTVTRDYITNAMNYYRSKFEKVIFVISSDNEQWVEKNINQSHKGEIYIVSSGYREVDMATLIRCNHTIMSTGTYSWWAAYLTNGTVVYYGGWPKRGTVLDKIVKKSDYFLENWIKLE
ncbi:unnamed protein product [Thelazia callipaeda]|uniref:L-Fucosyltransferase n=1 Tax=Thelazia callipaeda TaxID=103827 RepID=A0A0N5CKF9_THECL|nr:unnamed protein product [Thelazia callipaeda]